MNTNNMTNFSRRKFLLSGVTAGAGLTLGVYLGGCDNKDSDKSSTMEAGPGKAGSNMQADTSFEANAFVRIGSDNSVTVISKHLEMGQGSYTGMATLVAEELDASWEQINIIGAPADAKRYNNLFWGPAQGTGGSTAMANSFQQMRQAGATARAMLVNAAAKKWRAPAAEIQVKAGVLSHGKQRASFGELAELAGQQPVPEKVFLKDPEQFRLIGRALPRKDSHDKCYGKAIYTQDIQLPNMLIAVVAHAPRFGSTLKSFDASKAKAVKGVTDVVQIPSGVAVLASNTWSAKKGRDALSIEWDDSNAFKRGSHDIMAEFKRLAKNPGLLARNDGNAEQAMNQATQILQAGYEFPYLAHAALEPMNCVVNFTHDACEIWNGEQLHTGDQMAVAAALGIAAEKVTINMLYAGGSFGRRANPQSDYVLEAVNIAKAIDGKAPVKLVWLREDDTRAGYYRPMYYHQIKAGLNEDGLPISWQHRIVGQSIIKGTPFEGALIKNGIDGTSVEGAANLPYTIPNLTVDLHSPELGVPVQWWRSVGSTHTAFSVETFIDELAAATKQDPVDYRMALLKDHPRHQGVLQLAAQHAGWGSPLAEGQGRGVAVHESFNSYVAQVAEVTVQDDGSYSVDRVVIAVDCGIAVNPDIIKAQMEGGMGFGLSAVLSSKITLQDGKVEQSNFHDYTVLRMDKMPAVEVYIVPSAQPPTGVGEPATPVIAPAVANALFAATGERFYALPIEKASNTQQTTAKPEVA